MWTNESCPQYANPNKKRHHENEKRMKEGMKRENEKRMQERMKRENEKSKNLESFRPRKLPRRCRAGVDVDE